MILTLDLDDAGLARRILWVKFPETPSFYRQNFHGSVGDGVGDGVSDGSGDGVTDGVGDGVSDDG